MIYFDNAATTYPKPRNVNTAIAEYAGSPGRGGHELARASAKRVFEVREKAAKMFGLENLEGVVFTQNCTYALNTVIKGLLKKGDHVIISDLEHNSVLRPVHALMENGTIRYSVAQTSLNDEETVQAYKKLICPQTRALIVTHASNAFGTVLPIAKLGRLAKEYGCYFIVDAAQTAGTEKIDIARMGIDFLCMAGHKGLYGPPGTGMLITPNGELLSPLVEGGTGSLSQNFAQPDFMPDRLESGTVNSSGIYGLGAGMDFINFNGMENIAYKEVQIAAAIYDILHRTNGVILYTPKPEPGKNVGLLSFNILGLTSEQTTERLDEMGFALRGGLHCAPLAHNKYGTSKIGTARISVGAFNTMEQAHQLGEAIAKIAKTV